jgi:hypothetical protein
VAATIHRDMTKSEAQALREVAEWMHSCAQRLPKRAQLRRLPKRANEQVVRQVARDLDAEATRLVAISYGFLRWDRPDATPAIPHASTALHEGQSDECNASTARLVL